MLEWSLPPPRPELVVGLHKDLLDDVLDLAFQSGMTSGRGEHPRLMASDEFLETIDLPPANRLDDLGVGRHHGPRSTHGVGYIPMGYPRFREASWLGADAGRRHSPLEERRGTEVSRISTLHAPRSSFAPDHRTTVDVVGEPG